MDPFKLLSRSAKFSRAPKEKQIGSTPSSGRAAQPQLFASDDGSRRNGLGKRKRGQEGRSQKHGNEAALDLVNNGHQDGDLARIQQGEAEEVDDYAKELSLAGAEDHASIQPTLRLPLEERKRMFKQHKLKAKWLNSESSEKSTLRSKSGSRKGFKEQNALFPDPLRSFHDLSSRYGLSKRLSDNVIDQGYAIPTEVQMLALPLLLDNAHTYMVESDQISVDVSHALWQIDLLTVAPTGSGKTLAFMIPLLHSLLGRRQSSDDGDRYTSAIILAPTKELASQITNEGRKLVKGIGLSISQMRKGMKLPEAVVDESSKAEGSQEEQHSTVVKADIIVSTPGVLQGIIKDSEHLTWQIQHLILDEADVLLDPLFREQTLEIWNSLTEPSLRVSLWSATMGSNIEEMAKTVIRERHERLNGDDIAQGPLVRLIVGLKDSAVPNVKHKLTYAATERGKLLGLRQLLHPVSTSNDSGPALRPPFLVFTQTIERAIALHSELLYDIPAEAGGIGRIAVLHADLSDAKRDSVMTRFRKGDIWVLITTDLLSRGVDFRGVNGVVNYDIPTSSAAYVHRIGRTGRAGRDGGVAVTLYSKEDIPYLKHVVNVVAMAEKQKGEGGDVQQWLVDALPKLSKNDKQNLKKRGLEFKTAKGQKKDPKVAKRGRISSKAGYIRRVENNRKGAMLGNRRRREAPTEAINETEFAGFD